ncbi:hypothetical protein K1719_004976 [Acacia pycnantha]|nr:hypothetical protein K1719_004976 [Acacia pycnantha]
MNQVPPSSEEDDLLNQSSKKVKNSESICTGEEWPALGDARRSRWSAPGASFADKLQGIICTGNGEESISYDNDAEDDIMSDDSGKEDRSNFKRTEECADGENISLAPDAGDSDSPPRCNQEIWRVVHKPVRSKKMMKERAKGPQPAENSGSRFGVLAVDGGENGSDNGKGEVNIEMEKANGGGLIVSKEGGSVRWSRPKKGGEQKRGSRSRSTFRVINEEVTEKHDLRKEKRSREVGQSQLKEHPSISHGQLVVAFSDNNIQGRREDIAGSSSDLLLTDVEADLSSVPIDPGFGFGSWLPLVIGTEFFAAGSIFETKCDSVDRLRGISKIGFDGLACVPSVGRSGGLLAAWKSPLIEVEVLSLDRQMINLRCRFPNDRWFCVTVVYAIPDRDHKQLLWSSLFNIASSMAYPWIVIGDFNDIASPAERTGALGSNVSRCSLFSDPTS